MFVDLHDQHLIKMASAENRTDGVEPPPFSVYSPSDATYALGSPLPRLSTEHLEHTKAGSPPYRSFGRKLKEFLAMEVEQEGRLNEFLTVCTRNRFFSHVRLFIITSSQIFPYQCLYLKYMSLEDWREKVDILRCNPDFHHAPRYDCVVVNTDPITFARLEFIFSCEDNSKRRVDVALVRRFGDSTWKPRTKWEGCRVLEEKDHQFVLLKYLVQGCHIIPTFEKQSGRYYLNDLVDSDAFIRFFLDKYRSHCV